MPDGNPALEELFLRKKPARLLVHIKREDTPYASTLAKKIDCTYAHTVKLLTKMKEHGLVEFKKEGRVKFISLTNFGNDLADEFDILLNRRMSLRPSGEAPSEVEVPEEEVEEFVGEEKKKGKKR